VFHNTHRSVRPAGLHTSFAHDAANTVCAWIVRPRLFVVSILYFLLVSVRAAGAQTVTVELYPEGQPRSNPAILSFTGQKYEPNLPIPVPPKTSGNVPDEVKFLGTVIATNREGSLEDVLKLWDPKDRDQIRKLASDPKLFEGNRNFYRSIEESAVVVRVNYGPYQIFFVKHAGPTLKPLIKDYPVIRQNNSIYQTNALQGDPVFAYLSTKYAQTLQQNLSK
jgi:hypothetical protein